MPLFDNPPHVADVMKPATGTDAGGGVLVTFTVRTPNVRGILNRASSTEQLLYAQQGMTVSHTFVTRDNSAQRGDKLRYGTRSLHIVGIVTNDPIGNIPAHTRLVLSEQL